MEEDEEGQQVMSEVHVGCSPHLSFCLSSFTIGKHATYSNIIVQPTEAGKESFLHEQPSDVIDKHVSIDEGGDLDIPRRNSRCRHDEETRRHTISIYHRMKSNIPSVGLQIWKASLVLGDFILWILGILLAAKVRLVFLTDLNKDALDNCFRNVILNSRKSKASMGTLRIRQLDWQESWPPIATQIDVETSTDDYSLQYSWLESDLKELQSVSIIVAADVIYSDPLTDAFFSLLEKLMPSGSKKVLWLSLEKRYNFSLSELATVVHGYHHFQSFIDDRTEDSSSSPAAQLCGNQEARKSFTGKRIELNQIPQYLVEYERTNDLELWEIWRN